MKILAIETSCDDTGVSILEVSKTGGFDVLSNVVASQIEVHKKYGGVFPAMAKREHQKNLVPTLKKALSEANLLNKNNISDFLPRGKKSQLETILEREPELLKKLSAFLEKYQKPDIDLIAVTNGPGLEPCLWVGVNFAKALSYIWNIPVVPVNHIESHILVNYLNNPQINLPALALIVSGGHTQLILMKKIGSYKILGETRDDAAGECFDKCAKIMGLGYPGGPEIAKLAEKNRDPRSIQLPRPMINSKDYDFSFSGLKTAVLYAWQTRKQNSKFFCSSKKTYRLLAEFSNEIQQAIINVLIKKTLKAARDYKIKTIILGGGVSANKELRKQFAEKIQTELYGFLPRGKKPYDINFLVPPENLSTDNGLMTAITGYFHRKNPCLPAGRAWQKLQANANLRISK